MSGGTGSWLQFANRMNKFKGSYFQDFADISGDVIVRNTGDVYLHAGSNMYMSAGDISMNGFIYCKGVVDLSGNSLAGGGGGGGGGLTEVSSVSVKSLHTGPDPATSFITTAGYAEIGSYLNVIGSTTLTGQLTANGPSIFNGQLTANGASTFGTMSVGNVDLQGSIIPNSNAKYDIGSADKKIRDLYVSDSSIWIGDNNKLAVVNNKITMKKRKNGNADIPKFISDKLHDRITSDPSKIAEVKYFASLPANSLGKLQTDELSTYTVADWIRFANKKGTLSEDGFVKTNHTASDLYDLTIDFDDEDGGQWSTVASDIIKYDGKITVGNDVNTLALESLGKTTLVGKVNIGDPPPAGSNADLYVNGKTTNSGNLEVEGTTYLSTTNIANRLSVAQNANISGKMGVGKAADSTFHLDVDGKTRLKDDAYFEKSLLVGVQTADNLSTNNPGNASMYVEQKMISGLYPDISHNVIMDVPNTLFKANDKSVITNKNYLEIDNTNRRILPYIKDASGDFVNGTAADGTGWDLGGPGKNRFDTVYARDLAISTSTINIEDVSQNKISMSFDATTGAVNYTVRTKPTAEDPSGDIFVIKGVQTQRISSGSGTIDPALLEFTGLSFGDTFDTNAIYDFTNAYTYDLKTKSYNGDGASVFDPPTITPQTLSSFLSSTNMDTLLGSLPTKESAVIRVDNDDRVVDAGGDFFRLNGIDEVGPKVDLSNKIISVSDDDGGTTLKFTEWGTEDELYHDGSGNFLNYIELKNINMASGTYFVAKTGGDLVYNNANEENLKNDDLIGVVNGDLFLYIDRAPGNNWTKIPVSLPASGSITTQMLTNAAIVETKIATDAVTETKIAAAAITTSKIADYSITALKFKPGEITGTIFDDNSISGLKISDISGSKITGSISGDILDDDTIITTKIKDEAITGSKIGYLTVSGENLMSGSVTTQKIADDAVIASKIQDGVITSAKLATGVIDSDSLIADNVITETKISGGSVTASKIADDAITGSKIQDDAITESKIADGAVTLDKINGSVFDGKQDTLNAGNGISIDLGTNTISSTVSSTIADGSITNNLIAAGAITADKLAAGVGSGGGGGGGGGSVSGDIVADSIAVSGTSAGTFYKPEEIVGGTNDRIGYNIAEFNYFLGSPRNSVSMNDAGDLLVTMGYTNKVKIYKRTGTTWAVKLIFDGPPSAGLGATAIMSHDGTTVALMKKAHNWTSASAANLSNLGEYVYIHRDPTAAWDSTPTQVELSHAFYPTRFGLTSSLSSDGTKILITCVNPAKGTYLFIYNTNTSSATPIWSLNLNSNEFAEGPSANYNSSHRSWLTGDGNKILLRTSGTLGTEGALYVIAIDYTNGGYTVEYDYSASPESVSGPSSLQGSFIGASISRTGTRMFVPVNDGGASPTGRMLIYHYTNSSWVLNKTFVKNDVFTADDGTSASAPHYFAARTEFASDDTVGVISGYYSTNQTYTARIFYRFDYINNDWTLQGKTKIGTPLKYNLEAFVYLPSKTFAYVESTEGLYNGGRVTINRMETIGVTSNVLEADKLILQDGTLVTLPGSHEGFAFNTKLTGDSLVADGQLIVTSSTGNSATGFENSPTLVLSHGVGFGSKAPRPGILFRGYSHAPSSVSDWRLYTETGGSVNGDANNTHSMIFKLGTKEVLRMNDQANELSFNTATWKSTSTASGVAGMTIYPKLNSIARLGIIAGGGGGDSSTLGLELKATPNSQTDAVASIRAWGATAAASAGVDGETMSIGAKGGITFLTGDEKALVGRFGLGEAYVKPSIKMTIGKTGNVAMGKDVDNTYRLDVNGNLNVSGYLKTNGFSPPFSWNNTANIYADTPKMTSNTNGQILKGLGSSTDSRILMNSDGNLIVMSNVDLKTVYTFRKVGGVWEDFATVSVDNTKYISENLTHFGRAIALSGDGLTLTISDRTTIYYYLWNAGTSSWDKQAHTSVDSAFGNGFCVNMKLSNDGTKLMVLSWTASSNNKTRVYNALTGAELVVCDTGVDLFDPGNVYGTTWSTRHYDDSMKFRMAFSGDGNTVCIGGFDNSGSGGKTFLFDIDYTASPPTSTLGMTVQGTGGPPPRHQPRKGMAINDNGTVFIVGAGQAANNTSYIGLTSEARAVIYRRTAGTWAEEKTYLATELDGLSDAGGGNGDGFAERISMSSDGSIIYIGQNATQFYSHTQTPTYQILGRVTYDGSSWSTMLPLRGPDNSWWGCDNVTNSTGTTLAVASIKDTISPTVHGGGFYVYEVGPPDVTINSPANLFLNGGNGTGHITVAPTGDVGMGTPVVPGTKLTVSGNIVATGTVSGNSDDRLKENEELIINATDTIAKLRPEIYDKKSAFNDTNEGEWVRESGLMAQEMWYATPELRHLVTLGKKKQIVTESAPKQYDDKSTDVVYYAEILKDVSGNIYEQVETLYLKDDDNSIKLDASHNLMMNIESLLLLDVDNEPILHTNGKRILDPIKLKYNFLHGTPFTEFIEEQVVDSYGHFVFDASGIVQTNMVEKDTLDDNGMPIIDASGKIHIDTHMVVVRHKDIDSRPQTELVEKTKLVPINPSDIQDFVLTDDIQNDPDYKALGWGDTPASVNYAGLIPYLVKAIQEQQETIDTLKSEVDTLKNA